MKKEKALALLEGFPSVTPLIVKDIKNNLTKYLIADKNKAYCTHCEELFDIAEPPLHRQPTICPHCGTPTVGIRNHHNFCGSVVESSCNAIVFLSSPESRNLYVSCFTARLFFNAHQLMPHISLEETQRYVFTDKQAVRYGRNHYWTTTKNGGWKKERESTWTPRARFTEPQFDDNYHRYKVINAEAVNGTFLRYCSAQLYTGDSTLAYLKFYQAYPGAERLLKSGLGEYVRQAVESRNGIINQINWNEQEVHRMLGVSRDVCAAIRSNRITLQDYRAVSEHFPAEALDTLIRFNRVVGHGYGSLNYCSRAAAEQESAIVKYLIKAGVQIHDYYDYLRLASELNYDIANDRSVKFPPHFAAAHDRLVDIRQALAKEREIKATKEQEAGFLKRKKERKKLEFSWGEYIIKQPEALIDIINEGKVLSHCVGGYAQRHADGKLTIMFLRKKSEPDKPYYTIEVSRNYRIAQCRGYKNNWVANGGEEKPKEIKEVERQYGIYLDKLSSGKKKTTAYT